MKLQLSAVRTVLVVRVAEGVHSHIESSIPLLREFQYARECKIAVWR